MTEITLEAYTDEINQMVEEASYLEALTHLRHILNHYPRYLKAYYVLGEMLLEADLPQLAMDMFLRVLNAAPEHLLARIGLALTHDKLDNTQAAIWNLQRALELDPGNKDLGIEIRRLYERGGNVAPDYMALTRPGLARLYLRGNLYSRAEEELQQLLKENPQRIDLQLALAEAYWRDDRIVQAADACQQALDAIPYCLKANLLLGNLWLNSGQESGKRYLERAQEVDPDNHLAAELFGDASPLKEQKTAIERLVYEPDTLSVNQESAWFRHLEAASVSIGISEALPEMSDSEMKLVDIAAGLESQIQIPDWLRDLGPLTEEETGEMPTWLEEEAADIETVGAEAEGAEVEDAETLVEAEGVAAAPAATEEMPDWLQELQPPEAVEAAGAEIPIAAEGVAAAPAAIEEIPEWLQDLQPPEAVEAAGAEAEGAETPVAAEGVAAAPAATEEMPDWLQELQASESIETGEEGVVPTEAEEMFGWTSFPGAPPTAEAAGIEAPVEAVGVTAAPAVTEDAEAPVAAEGIAAAPAATEEIPDWLQELQAGESTETGEEGVVPSEAEEMFGWTSFPGARPTAEAAGVEAPVEAEGVAAAPAATEEIPEWLQELQPPETPAEAAPVAPPTEAEDAETPVEAPTEAEEMLSGDDALAWLAGLAEGKEDELRAQADVEQEARVAEILGRRPAAPVAEAEAVPVTPPTEAEGAEAPAEAEELLSGDDALAWLAGLAEGKEDELRAQADVEQEARVAKILGRRPAAPVTAAAGVAAAPAATVEAEVKDVEAEEIPEWLQELQPPEAKAPAEAVPVAPPTEAEGAEAPAEAEELLSGDDALAWLAGLAEGKEDELRAQADVEQEARVAEILGRRPAAEAAEAEAPVEAEGVAAAPAATEEIPEWLQELQPPEAEAPAEAVPVAPPTEEGEELLSGDDALAWLAGLAEGKEDELRAQADVEQEARVAKILGRRPAAPVAETVEAEPVEIEAERVEAPAEAEEMLSGDDALAWLAGLAEGKEDELRAQADVEQEARVAEILGRRPAAPVAEAPAEAEGVAAAPAATEEIPEWLRELRPPTVAEEISVTAEGAAAPGAAAPEEEKPFFGWSVFDVETTEAEQAPETVEPEPLTSFGFTRFKEEEAIAAPEAPVEAEGVAAVPAVTEGAEAPAEAVEPEIPEEVAIAAPAVNLDEDRAYVATHDSDYKARLVLAQSLWQAGEIEEATRHYEHLIRTDQFLTEIASDLKKHTAAPPHDPYPLRALGDVYMRQGALEQALDCYRQALQLL